MGLNSNVKPLYLSRLEPMVVLSKLEKAAQLEQELSEAEAHALNRLNAELEQWLQSSPPFRGRACDKLLSHQ